MQDLFNFKNKTILITGASSGIGKETAIFLSKQGAKIILLGRNEEKLKEIIPLLDENKHSFFVYDFSQIEGIETLIKDIVKKNGAIDAFVHSAGTGEIRPLSVSKYPFMLKVMNINFFSFIEIIRCITKKGNYNAGLNIVGVSAIGAFLGNATKTGYNASKAAMNAATRSLAKELASKKIRVNTVAPGATKTAMYDNFNELGIGSEEMELITQRQYLGICQPLDIAYSIAFLLSDMSKMITGSSIGVDGGKLTS